MNDNELSLNIRKNPIIGRLMAGAMIATAVHVAAWLHLQVTDYAEIAGVSAMLISAAAWPLAHAVNSLYARFVVPAYWRLFPPLEPTPHQKQVIADRVTQNNKPSDGASTSNYLPG